MSEQDNADTLTKEFSIVRSKVLISHSIRSIINARITKSIEKIAMCFYNIDTDRDGCLMPFKMFKMLCPYTTIADLNKCTDRKVVLWMYNNLCILQLGICKVTIVHKGVDS